MGARTKRERETKGEGDGRETKGGGGKGNSHVNFKEPSAKSWIKVTQWAFTVKS